MHIDDIARIAAASLVVFAAGVAGCEGCADHTDESPSGDAWNDGSDLGDHADATEDARETGSPADATDAADGTNPDTTGDAQPSDDGDGLDADSTGDASDAIDSGGDTAPADTAPADTRPADTGPADTVRADTGTDAGSDTGPAGLSVPCSNGKGWTVFKFHWSQHSGPSPRIDVWDASCSYSIAPGSACRVSVVGSSSFNSRKPRAVLLSGSDVLRVRYDVSTLQFTKAKVYVQARSYSTTSSTHFRVWSPIYGGKKSPGLVDNDWIYDWYGVPWSNYLSPNDKPSLTAIEISDLGGDKLAVHSVELCVR